MGVIGLALVGTGTLVFLKRDTVFKNFVEAWDTQGAKTEATLFRWGELMSIGAKLKDRYGAEPELTYDTSTGDRTLDISFSDYQLPDQVTAEGHAREIAAFAIGKTKKSKHIDAVRVLFKNPGSGPYTFAVGELTHPGHGAG